MKRKPAIHDYLLYLVTDPVLHKGYSVLEQIELALRGGVKMIQIRDKGGSQSSFIELALRALKLTYAHDAFLIINDSVEVARESGSDGVHLGQEDMPVDKARTILGDNAIIGVSVKTVDEAMKAEKEGADYVAVNGVFPTATKSDLGYIPGLEAVMRIRRNISLPVIGIGGINLGNCASVIASGADGVAVVTALTLSENIPETCRSFFDIMTRNSCH